MGFDDISVCYLRISLKVFENYEIFIQCLNQDGVSINLDVTLQFQADPSHLYDIVVQFKDFEGYKKILYATGRAAVHDTCAQ